MLFTNFTTGKSHSFGGTYLELMPHERIRYTNKFDDPNLPGDMQTTVTLTKVSCGTELHVVQEGLPDAIPPDACYLGWQESLVLLAQVECGQSGRHPPRGRDGAGKRTAESGVSALARPRAERLCGSS
jgi:hypothetical protein